jgi:hypothetical protein
MIKLFVIRKDTKSFIIFDFYFDVGYFVSLYRIVRNGGQTMISKDVSLLGLGMDLVRTWYGTNTNIVRMLFLLVFAGFSCASLQCNMQHSNGCFLAKLIT